MRIVRIGLAALALCMAQFTSAAPYPERSITMVVPFAAGGGTDILARVVAERLSDQLGTSVIVENRPGASAQIGTRHVIASAPDGYTLLVATNSLITGPYLFPDLPYDSRRDLKPVVSMADLPIFLAVNSKHNVHTLAEFIKLAKDSHGALNYGSAGPGTTLHMAAEWLKSNAGFEATHIPFKGSGLAVTALAAGHVDFNMENLGAVQAMAQAKRVDLLAVAARARHPSEPDVPTMKEAGLADVNLATWVFLMAPAGTPDEAVTLLNTKINQILQEDATKQRLLQQGFVVTGGTSAEVLERMTHEGDQWGGIIKSAGISIK